MFVPAQKSILHEWKRRQMMEGKRVRDSSVIMAQMMIPQDANPAGNVHGGVVVKIIDEAAGVVAARHSRSNVVTASIDRMDFHHPVFVGDVLFFKASLNLVGRTSMEIGVRVEAENLLTGEVRHAASAYLTYVALDQHGKPREIAPLILEIEEETRRNREAKARREIRLAEKKREAGCQKDPGTCT
jgi:acyl-CoA hydrolase